MNRRLSFARTVRQFLQNIRPPTDCSQTGRKYRRALMENLESRRLLNAAFDVVGLTALRADSTYSQVDGSGIGIAILDSGVLANHPDLKSNFTVYFDAVTHGRDAFTDPGDTNAADTIDPTGHGTHVSG